ncbi:MAG: hypothetical protein JWM89_3962, partial [Acidimicrobiales bacterium]|nr:hypothetical protein [Acidimicrobiales bacterium]
GLATLGAVRVARSGPRPASVALLVAGTAAGMLLRTEGALVGIAIAVALVVAMRAAGQRWSVTGAVAAGQLVLVGAVTKVEGLWVHHIDGGGSQTFVARTAEAQASGFVQDRLHAAWVSGLEPGTGSLRTGSLVLLALVAILAFAVARGRPLMEAWQAAAGVLVLALLLGLAMAPTEVVSGIVPAWPLAVVGLGAAGWAVLRRLPVEIVWVVLYVGAIIATQYADGGAVQWGGRFYAPLTVPVAVVAAAGLLQLRRAATTAAVVGIVAALLVVPTFAGVTAVRAARSSSHQVFEELDAELAGSDVTVTAHQHLPRMMWAYDDVRWLVVEDHGSDMAHLLRSLASNRAVHRVSLVVRVRDERLVAGALASTPAWRKAGTEHAGGLEVVHLRR